MMIMGEEMATVAPESSSNLSASATSEGVSEASAGISSALQAFGIDSSTIVHVILVLVLAYVSTRIVAFLLTRFSERFHWLRLGIKMEIPLAKLAIYGFAVYHILGSIFQLSTSQLIALSGLVGAAVGFGLKDLIAEIVGGIVLVLDKPYQIGDKVRIDGHYGEVTDIGLRATRLVSPDDSLIVVSNQRMITQVLANATAGSLEMQVVIDLFIDSSSAASRAMKILRDAAVTSRYVYISSKRPVTIFLKDYPFYKRVRARVYVNDLRYEFKFESDVTKRAWDAFLEAGIEPPKAMVMDPVSTSPAA